MEFEENLLQNKRVIGITGGIGTGKTTVSKYLHSRYQLPILDADVLAREAVEPHSIILPQIVKRYGSGILLTDGNLNRPRLGDIIFKDSLERQWLEAQIHPYVRDRIFKAIQQLPFHQTLVLAIPLLFEAQMTDLVTEIWVVYCSYQQQLERIIKRNSLTSEQAADRIKAQMPLQEKCQKADIVLDNSSTLESLFHQVDLALASE